MTKLFGSLLVPVLFGLAASPSWAVLDARTIDEIKVLCDQLLADYAVYRDHLDADNFANTFSDDAVLVVGSGEHKGREAIRKYIINQPHPANAHMFMFTSSHIVPTSEFHATGISYALVLGADRPVQAGDEPIQVAGVRAVNEYYTEFKLTEEGWKISRLSLQGKFAGPR